jgi:hypothetical protein
MDDIFIMPVVNDLGLVSQLGTWLMVTELTEHICRSALYFMIHQRCLSIWWLEQSHN